MQKVTKETAYILLESFLSSLELDGADLNGGTNYHAIQIQYAKLIEKDSEDEILADSKKLREFWDRAL